MSKTIDPHVPRILGPVAALAALLLGAPVTTALWAPAGAGAAIAPLAIVHAALSLAIWKAFRRAVERARADAVAEAGRRLARETTHDLRKPFSSLRLALQAIQSTDRPESVRELAQLIEPQVAASLRNIEEKLAALRGSDRE